MTTITQIEDSVFDFVAAVLPDRLAFLENQDGVLRPKITIDEGRPYVAYKVGMSDTFAHAPSRLIDENVIILSDQSENTEITRNRSFRWDWTPDRDYRVSAIGLYAAAVAGQSNVRAELVRIDNETTDINLLPRRTGLRTFDGAEAAFRYFELDQEITFSEGDEITFQIIAVSGDFFHAPDSPSDGISTAIRICDGACEAINQRSLIRVDLDIWRGEAVADGVRLQAACNAEIGLRTIFQHTGRSAVSPVQDLAEVVQGKIAPRAMMTISAYANLEYQFAASYFDKIQINDNMIERVSVTTESD